MPLKYDLFPNPGENEVKGYHPRLLPVDIVDEEQLCDLISEQSSITPADVLSVMSSLANNMNRFLLGGRKVRVNSIGTLYLTVGSAPVSDYNKNPKTLHVKKLSLIPHKDFELTMKSESFSRKHILHISRSQRLRIDKIIELL